MKTENKIAIMQAWLNKEPLQYMAKNSSRWKDVPCDEEPVWDWGRIEYRKKPKIRPYLSAMELLDDIITFGKLNIKDGNGYFPIHLDTINSCGIVIKNKEKCEFISFEELLNSDGKFVFSRNTSKVCGIEIFD